MLNSDHACFSAVVSHDQTVNITSLIKFFLNSCYLGCSRLTSAFGISTAFALSALNAVDANPGRTSFAAQSVMTQSFSAFSCKEVSSSIQHPKKQEFKKNVMSDVMFTVWSCVTKAEKQT
jgi:hypothetical protein